MPITVLVLSMLMVVVAAGVALAATRYCDGHGDYCYGTANADTVYDGPGSDIIQARAGGDVVRAGHYLRDYDDVYGGRGGDLEYARATTSTPATTTSSTANAAMTSAMSIMRTSFANARRYAQLESKEAGTPRRAVVRVQEGAGASRPGPFPCLYSAEWWKGCYRKLASS